MAAVQQASALSPLARQKSASQAPALHVVDEFHSSSEEEEYDDEEQAAGPEDAHGDQKGKLSTWFKGLFKKDKSSNKSSKSSSRQGSATQVAGQSGHAPVTSPSGATTSKPVTPTTPPDASSQPYIVPPALRSKSLVSPNGTTALRPHSPKAPVADEGPSSARADAAAALDSPASRSKSMSLKSELSRLRNSPLQHSKSFTELSQKAKTVPKRGNEVLISSPTAPPRMQRADWSLRDYAVVEKMYKGYASSVYKAFCKRSGELVCLKAYDMAALCELNRFQIYREVQLHGKLGHPNVIGLYGAFQVDSQVVMVQEFADGGDLFTLLHRYGGRMPERQAVEMVLAPCLKVLLYLHEQGILHRDIKPENILFTRNMTFKLCDFGLAIDLRDERAVTRAGTLEYMAPEVLECPFKSRPIDNKENERLHYTAAVDAWAVGVLAYELLVGRPPFEAPEREGVEECIRRQVPRFPFGLSENARSFIATALQKDPDQRPTVLDMLNHPFVRSGPPPSRPASSAAPGAGGSGTQTHVVTATASAAAQAARPAGSATAAASLRPAPPGDHLPAVVAPAKAIGGGKVGASRAIAAAGGMDDDDLGVGALASRMKSYTAGKAIAISHQALQANRHVHLPHVGDDSAARSAGPQGGVGSHLGPGANSRPATPSGEHAPANPKLAALKNSATMVNRTASVSRLM
ncbi:hypothetical protein HYH03_007588 [Edaphochlamys debaryana]|uniref:Protein kinase domain-containing protein n=1 Tax=Edaphochlamys debaryana TaxID=47281 RepID=A0A836C090_9CHLO|nr:hypothetical protein HYH03_007588 [Edaphochlamys debaryana]|eukprot:KAG2494233.1 hypothetical protein HYH03_007588 [Edaphochlamys debaryana]